MYVVLRRKCNSDKILTPALFSVKVRKFKQSKVGQILTPSLFSVMPIPKCLPVLFWVTWSLNVDRSPDQSWLIKIGTQVTNDSYLIYLYSHTAKYNGTEKNNNIIIT